MTDVRRLVEERYIMKKKLDLSYIKRWKVEVDDLEDVYHTAIVRAIKYEHAYQDKLPFDNWFCLILQNCVKDHLRVERRQGMSDEFVEEVHFIDTTVPDNERGENLLEKVREDIKWEKEDNREILYLYFILGYKLREVNEIVEPSYDSVRGLVKRFTAKMREKYDQIGLGC